MLVRAASGFYVREGCRRSKLISWTRHYFIPPRFSVFFSVFNPDVCIKDDKTIQEGESLPFMAVGSLRIWEISFSKKTGTVKS